MRDVIFLLLVAVLQASFGSICGVSKCPYSGGNYLIKQPCNEHIFPPLRYCEADPVHLGGASSVDAVRYVTVEPEHTCLVPQYSPHCNQQVVARNVPQSTLLESSILPHGCKNVVAIDSSASISFCSSACRAPTHCDPNIQLNPNRGNLCVKHVLVNKVCPVYDECIQTVPVIKKFIRHEPVTTVENVPVIERRISYCTEPECCDKCIEPEYVSVPCPGYEFEREYVSAGSCEPRYTPLPPPRDPLPKYFPLDVYEPKPQPPSYEPGPRYPPRDICRPRQPPPPCKVGPRCPYTYPCEPRCLHPPCDPMPPRYPPRCPCEPRCPPPPCDPMPPRYPPRCPCEPRCPPPPCDPMPPRYPPRCPCEPRCPPPPYDPMPPRYPSRDPCEPMYPPSPCEPMLEYSPCEPKYPPPPCRRKPKYTPCELCRPRYPPPPPSPCPYEGMPLPPAYKPRHQKPYRPRRLLPPRRRRPKYPLPEPRPRPDIIEDYDTPKYITNRYPQQCPPQVHDKIIHIPLKRRGYRSVVEQKVVPMSVKRKIKKNLVQTTIKKTYAPCDCC